MAGTLKGITLRIGGDVTDLQKALKQVDKNISDSAKTMSALSAALKHNPKDQILIEQQQKTIQAQIKNTEERLRTLREAAKTAIDQLNAGEISEDQYVKLQSEIARSENALKKLREESDKVVQSFEKAGKKLQDTGKKMADVGDKMTRTISAPIIGLAGVGVKFAAEAKAIEAQFEQTFEKSADVARARVDELGESFGMLPNRIKPAFTQATAQFKGLGADVEQAMEAAGTATTIAADAAAFYDRSMEEAQSSLNSFVKGNYEGGEAIGLFANETQLAAWASENLGLKWKDLGELDKQMTRLKFAEAMQDAAGAAGQAARESESFENQLGNLKQSAKDALAELAAPLLEPAIAGLGKLADTIKNIVEWYNSLGPVAQGVLNTMIGVGAVAGPVLSSVGRMSQGLGAISSGIGKAVKSVNSFKASGQSLTTVLGSGVGTVGLAGALAAVTVALVAYRAEMNEIPQDVKELIRASEEARDSFSKETTALSDKGKIVDELTERLFKLTGQTSRTAEAQAEIKLIINDLNKAVPDLNLAWDEQTGKLNLTREAILKTASAYKTQAKATALGNEQTRLAEERLEIERKLSETQAKLTAEVERGTLAWAESEKRYTFTMKTDREKRGGLVSLIETYKTLTEAQEENARRTEEIADQRINALLEESKADEELSAERKKRRDEDLEAERKAAQDKVDLLKSVTDEQNAEYERDKQNQAAINAAKRELGAEHFENLLKDREEFEAKQRERDEEYYKAREEALTRSLEEAQKLQEQYTQDIERETDNQLSIMQYFADGEVEAVNGAAEEIRQINLKKLEGFQQYSANMAELESKVSEEMMQSLREMGPSAAGLIAEYNAMTREELAKHDDVWREMHKAAADAAQEEISKATGYTQEELDKMVGLFANSKSEFETNGRIPMAGLRSGLDSMSPQIQALAKKIMQMIKDQTGVSLYAQGQNAAKGFRDGLASQEESIGRTASRIAGLVDKTTRMRLMIKSPSKVMSKLGANASQGLALGLDQNAGEVVAATARMLAPLTDAEVGLDVGIPTAVPERVISQTITTRLEDGQFTGLIDYEKLGAATARAMRGVKVEASGRAIGELTIGEFRAAAFAKGGLA